MKAKIFLLMSMLLGLLSPDLLAKEKGYFNAEAGVKFNIMLNDRARRLYDAPTVDIKSTDNFTFFSKFYYTYFTKNNKLTFYSGISLQNSQLSRKHYETWAPRYIVKNTTNIFKLMYIQGVIYDLKKINIGAEFGFPIFMQYYAKSVTNDKQSYRDAHYDTKWFYPDFYINSFISEKINTKRYNFFIKQGIEYSLINYDNYYVKKRHVLSFFVGIQLPFTKNKKNEKFKN